MHIIKWESNINKKGISDHKRRKKGGKKAHDQECKSMSISLTPIETNKSSREDSNRISGLYIPLNYTSFSPSWANNTPTTLYPLQDDVLTFYCNSSSDIFVPPPPQPPQPRHSNLNLTFVLRDSYLHLFGQKLVASMSRPALPAVYYFQSNLKINPINRRRRRWGGSLQSRTLNLPTIVGNDQGGKTMHCDCISVLSRLRSGKQTGVLSIRKRPQIRKNI